MRETKFAVACLAVVLLSGCLEPQKGLDLSIKRNNYLNLIELTNNADIYYNKCRLIADKNWTFDGVEIPAGGKMMLQPANFTTKDGYRMNSSAVIGTLEVYCKEGYYGGVFTE